MEPVYLVEVTVASGNPLQQLDTIGKVLAARRGSVLKEVRNAGTPLCTLRGLLPVIDSFGFESEVRTRTCGEVYPVMIFDHWAPVPGDPYDLSVRLAPMAVAKGFELARDFTMKTRKRKGLSDDLP
jgi:U5 small nuclear ribonucleoprotein component